MRASRLIAGLVVVALVATVVFAVTQSLAQDDSTNSDGDSTPTIAPTPTPEPGSSEPPTADLASFYAQELTWESCRDDFECATLTVPIDYQDPGGETIEVALLKDPADDPAHRVGSLIVNPGGPGVPGTSYAENSTEAFGGVIRHDFDIVGFDPRGTGDSDPVDCISDADLDAFTAADPDPDTPQEAADFEAATEDVLPGLRRQLRQPDRARHHRRGGS